MGNYLPIPRTLTQYSTCLGLSPRSPNPFTSYRSAGKSREWIILNKSIIVGVEYGKSTYELHMSPRWGFEI